MKAYTLGNDTIRGRTMEDIMIDCHKRCAWAVVEDEQGEILEDQSLTI